MDFLTSTALAATRLRTSPIGDERADQTALLLVGHAAQQLAAHDDVWSLLALDVLDVTAELYPHPEPVVLEVDPPTDDDATTRRAVDEVLGVLADRYEEASAVAPDTRLGLLFGSSAIRLRRAAAQLT